MEALGLPGSTVVENPPANAGDAGDTVSIPGSRRFPWRRVWLPTPVFLPGESHEQKPGRPQAWGCEESDTTEQPSTRRMRFNDVHKIFGPR